MVFVALMLAMCQLGEWQFHRYQQTNRNDHRISLTVHSPTVALEGAVTLLGAWVSDGALGRGGAWWRSGFRPWWAGRWCR